MRFNRKGFVPGGSSDKNYTDTSASRNISNVLKVNNYREECHFNKGISVSDKVTFNSVKMDNPLRLSINSSGASGLNESSSMLLYNTTKETIESYISTLREITLNNGLIMETLQNVKVINKTNMSYLFNKTDIYNIVFEVNGRSYKVVDNGVSTYVLSLTTVSYSDLDGISYIDVGTSDVRNFSSLRAELGNVAFENNTLVNNVLCAFTQNDFRDQCNVVTVDSSGVITITYESNNKDYNIRELSMADSFITKIREMTTDTRKVMDDALSFVMPLVINGTPCMSYINTFMSGTDVIMLMSIGYFTDIVNPQMDHNVLNKATKAFYNCCQIVNLSHRWMTLDKTEFSNELSLLQSNESGSIGYPEEYSASQYLFAFQSNDGKSWKCIQHGKYPYFEGRLADKCYVPSTDDTVMSILSKIIADYDSDNWSTPSLTKLTVYEWINGMKVSTVRKFTKNGTQYLFGSGIDVEQIAPRTLTTYGTVQGTGIVDYRDNQKSIHKIDTVNKEITINGLVGINAKNPTHMLEVNDVGVDGFIDILHVSDVMSKRLSEHISVLSKMSTDPEMTQYISSQPQEYNSYFALYNLNNDMTNILDWKLLYSYVFPSMTLGELHQKYLTGNDEIGETMVREAILFLSKQLLFDGAFLLWQGQFYTGFREVIGRVFRNSDGNLYALMMSENLQSHSINVQSNPKWNTSFNVWDWIQMSWMHMVIMELGLNTSYIANYVESVANLKTIKSNLDREGRKYNVNYYLINRSAFSLGDCVLQEISLTTNASDIPVLEKGVSVMLKDLDYEGYLRFSTVIQELNSATPALNTFDRRVLITQDEIYDYIVDYIELDIVGFDGIVITTRIQDILVPTARIEGDTSIKGDLIVSDKDVEQNFFSIDPRIGFIGVGSDIRYSKYFNEYLTTTSNISSQTKAIIHSDSYPNLVCERVAENAAQPEYYSRSFSGITTRRMSRLYSFKEMKTIGDTYNNQFGVDMSFEIKDKTDMVQELGNVAMVVESINEDGQASGAFKIVATETLLDKSVKQKQIMYVSNDSELRVKRINLDGAILENNNGDLYWNGKKVLTA
jgi:hypothetical protein